MTLIKSISGIRGTIGGGEGDNLTPADIVKFTGGYASWLAGRNPGKRLRVVVGRDARLSGEMVQALVVGTLTGCGADVIDVGLCTTPGVEMAVTAKKAHGGVIITASHNPRQWNALKLLNEKGEFLSAADGARVLELSADTTREYAGIDRLGAVIESCSFDDQHIKAVLALPLVDVGAIRAAGFKAVVDAVNSVGGIVIPRLLRELGVEVVELNCDPTGEFAHNPEPLPENLTEISSRVVSAKADLGIVVDPDVDRLALVCEDGTMFGEEYTLVAAADYVLSKTPGNTVSNLSSTRALREVAESYGCGYAAAAVGEVNVVEKMKATGAVIGGEGNGGVIYPALHYGRDALVGVALFLSKLAESGLKMSQLRDSYPRYHISKNKIELTPGINVDAVLDGVEKTYSGAGGKTDRTDGLKVDLADGWVHLRKSNTEPIIRTYSEGRGREEAERLAAEAIGRIKSAAGK